MSDIIRTVTFECPPLAPEVKSRYLTALGQINNPNFPGMYGGRQFRLKSRSKVPQNYPVFDASGNIKLRIHRSAYKDVREFTTEESKFAVAFPYADNCTYRKISTLRLGFEITIEDYRYPLRLLLERIATTQESTGAFSAKFKTIKCWDETRFDFEAFERGDYKTFRIGAIETIQDAGDGDGVSAEGLDGCELSDGVPDFPKFFCGPYTVRFMESRVGLGRHERVR